MFGCHRDQIQDRLLNAKCSATEQQNGQPNISILYLFKGYCYATVSLSSFYLWIHKFFLSLLLLIRCILSISPALLYNRELQNSLAV